MIIELAMFQTELKLLPPVIQITQNDFIQSSATLPKSVLWG